tara:strand:+ start:4098 stop:4391 length:294 start_codon:yes stop_codon:yes gene_type:complete
LNTTNKTLNGKEKKMTTTETTDTTEFTLSDQAVGTVMMALQKSLMEQSDIVPTLKGLRLTTDNDNNLVVLNPPLVKMSHEDADTLSAAGTTDTTETE